MNKDFSIHNKCLFGGSPVIPMQSFGIFLKKYKSVLYSNRILDYVSQAPQEVLSPQMQEQIDMEKFADAQKRKKRIVKQVQSKGTDTNEDIRALLSSLYISEKQSELSQLQHDAELNMIELNKMIKLKVLWEAKQPSGVQNKLRELALRIGKGGHYHDNWINEQLKQFGQQDNIDTKSFTYIETELKDNIEMVQSQTAHKIFNLAELKMREIFDKNVLRKAVRQVSSKKTNNYSRLEDLENVIIAKNLEIQKKQIQIDNLYNKFESNEKKLQEFVDQIESYQKRIFNYENQKQNAFQSQINTKGNYDVGIQVLIPEPFLLEVQQKLKTFTIDNLKMKEIISQMKEAAHEEKQNTAQPSSINEAIVMILSSDLLSTEQKIEGVQELLIYVKGRTQEELVKTTAKDMYQWITVKLETSVKNKDNKFDFMYGENKDEFEQFQKLKKLFSGRRQKLQNQKKHNETINETENSDSPSPLKKKKNKNKNLSIPIENQMKKRVSQININMRKSVSSNQLLTEKLSSQQSQKNLLFEQKSSNKIKISTNRQSIKLQQFKDEALFKKQLSEDFNNEDKNLLLPNQSIHSHESVNSEQGDFMNTSQGLQRISMNKNNKKSITKLSILKQGGSFQKNESISPDSNKSKSKSSKSKSPKQKSPRSKSPKSKSPKSKISQSTRTLQNRTDQKILHLKSQEFESSSNSVGTNIKLYPSQDNTINQNYQNNQTNTSQIISNRTDSISEINQKKNSYVQSFSNKIKTQRKSIEKIIEIKLQSKIESITDADDQQQNVEQSDKPGQTLKPSHFLRETQNQQIIIRDQVSSIISRESYREKTAILKQITESDIGSYPDVMSPKFNKKSTVNIIQTFSVYTQTDFSVFQEFILESLRGVNLSDDQLKSFKDKFKISFGSEAPTSNTRNNSVLYSSNLSLNNQLHKKTGSGSGSISQNKILGDMLQKSKTSYSKRPWNSQTDFDLKLDQMDELAFEQAALKENLGEPFEIINDNEIMNEGVIKKLYSGFQARQQSQWKSELILKIIKYLNIPQTEQITYNLFSNYYLALLNNHKQCGDYCIHLKRFFNRLGFITRFYSKRRVLHAFKSEPIPFRIDNRNQTSSSNSNRFNEKNNNKYYY